MSNTTIEKEETESMFRILLLSIIALLAVFMAFVGGSLKWIVGLSIIIFIGAIIIFEIYNRTVGISDWERDNELDSIVNLNLEKLSEIAGRAYRDRTISKALLEERIKEEFIKKVKNHKNISDAKMERLLQNPEKLREIIDDDVITEFIVGSKSYNKVIHEESKSKKSFLEKLGFRKITIDKNYKERIDEVLDRMEEWN